MIPSYYTDQKEGKAGEATENSSTSTENVKRIGIDDGNFYRTKGQCHFQIYKKMTVKRTFKRPWNVTKKQ